MSEYVVYTCDHSGGFTRPQLSLAAQECDIAFFLDRAGTDDSVLEYFTDHGNDPLTSGERLDAALDLCRQTGAMLLVARADVLPFDEDGFIESIRDLDLRVAVTPDAGTDELLIHLRLVRDERRFDLRKIPSSADVERARQAVTRSRRQDDLASVAEIIVPMRQSGATLDDIASTLNRTGLTTVRGTAWRASHISNVLQQMERRPIAESVRVRGSDRLQPTGPGDQLLKDQISSL